MIEIEKRYRVLDEKQLSVWCANLVYRSTQTIIDDYLDTPEAQYYQRGIFIRLRNQNRLDIKFNPSDLKAEIVEAYGCSCQEHSFSRPFEVKDQQRFESLQALIGLHCPQPFTYEAFLETNTLGLLVRVDKAREIYTLRHDSVGQGRLGDAAVVDMVVSVDRVRGLPTIIEFEAQHPPEVASEEQIERFISHFSYAVQQETISLSLEPLRNGYVEQLLKIQNETLYRKGKYAAA